MRLSEEPHLGILIPLPNEIRNSFVAAVVYDNDFEAWCIRLLRQGSQALMKGRPVVVNT
jgi:hypothetical protein